MTLAQHQRAVRTVVGIAGAALIGAVALQAILQTDFRGVPFLVFGLTVLTAGATLLVRLWAERGKGAD